MHRRVGLGWFLGTAMLVPMMANAQSASESAARRVLLDQAAAARAANDHAQALQLGERAGRIQMTPSLRMFIAEEQLALGRFAPALGTADLCVRETERDTSVRNRDAILSHCQAMLTDLRTRVAYITLRVPDRHPSDLRVTVAGDTISDALYGVPYVVTPGAITIDAAGAGIEPFHREVTVTPGATQTVDVTFVDMPIPVASSSSPAPAAAATASGTNRPPPVSTPSNGHTHPPLSPAHAYGPYALAGFGLVAIGTSIGFFLARNGAASGCSVQSDAIWCPDAASAARAQPAPLFNSLADITLGLGAVAIAGGIAWFVATRLPTRSANDARRTTVFLTPSTTGLTLSLQRGF